MWRKKVLRFPREQPVTIVLLWLPSHLTCDFSPMGEQHEDSVRDLEVCKQTFRRFGSQLSFIP